MVDIDPVFFQKREKRHKQIDPYIAACCGAHKLNEIDILEECDHTHPWED